MRHTPGIPQDANVIPIAEGKQGVQVRRGGRVEYVRGKDEEKEREREEDSTARHEGILSSQGETGVDEPGKLVCKKPGIYKLLRIRPADHFHK
jgi:hypothetical protein